MTCSNDFIRILIDMTSNYYMLLTLLFTSVVENKGSIRDGVPRVT
jgi:hypothetical protein